MRILRLGKFPVALTRGPKDDLLPLRLPWGSSLPLLTMTRFNRNYTPYLILPLTTYFQGSVAVGNRVEDLLSRVTELEEQFNSRPHNIPEQRRREKLRQYVPIFPLDSVLSCFQWL